MNKLPPKVDRQNMRELQLKLSEQVLLVQRSINTLDKTDKEKRERKERFRNRCIGKYMWLSKKMEEISQI